MLKKTTTEAIDNVLLNFFQGSITPEEKIELKNWIALNDDNKAEFKKLYVIWKASSLQQQNDKTIQNALDRVNLHIITNQDDKPSLPNRIKFTDKFYSSFRKWAAIFIGIILASASILYFISKIDYSAKMMQANNVISVPLGSKSKIILPDGTEVWLNAGSKLTYTLDYGKKTRDVKLTGEGYFKVFRMEDKPFIVHTSRANIKALGTEFNVKAYPDENFIETILVKGSVAVDRMFTSKNSSSKSNSLILKPGQKARIYKAPEVIEKDIEVPQTITPKRTILKEEIDSENEITLQNTNTQIETSWKDDRWIIKGENLDVLAVLLARRFNVSITLTDENLLKYKFSGTIQNETLEQVCNIMALTIPIDYSIDKGKVTIHLNTKFEQRYKAAYK